MQAKVQDCGCISIPEELVERSGLRPGAACEISFRAEERGLLIVADDPDAPFTPLPAGSTCG